MRMKSTIIATYNSDYLSLFSTKTKIDFSTSSRDWLFELSHSLLCFVCFLTCARLTFNKLSILLQSASEMLLYLLCNQVFLKLIEDRFIALTFSSGNFLSSFLTMNYNFGSLNIHFDLFWLKCSFPTLNLDVMLPGLENHPRKSNLL